MVDGDVGRQPDGAILSTDSRACEADGESRELFTEFDVLLQLEKQLDSVQPTGFIFHSSRCGSTLVANACRAITNSIVLSEANAIDKLIARFITDADGAVKESLYSVFLRGVVHALAQRRAGNEQHLFIKFACCSFAQIERIRRIWPNVPWLFLYRDPVETIVSNVKDVPPWLIDNDRRVLASIIGDRRSRGDEPGRTVCAGRSEVFTQPRMILRTATACCLITNNCLYL